MVKSNPYTPSLNAGEFTPRLAARTDFAKYPAGLETALNVIPLSEGGLMRRAGTRFVAEMKSSSVKGRIKRFEFSTTQAYILELGEKIMRFYRHQGQIISGVIDASIANGTFTSNITDWDDVSAGSGSIAHDAPNGRLSLIPGGTGSTDIGWAQQDIAVGSTVDANEHILKFRVLGAPSDRVELRVGTTSSGNELIADAEVEVGYATYAFTPGDGNNTVYVQFRNLGSFRNKTVQIDDVSLIASTVSALGAIEIDTPWAEAELYEVNGPQSADTLYLYHPSHPTHKLLRLGHTSWVLPEVAWQDGPYLTENATTTTLTPAAATGLGVNVTASSVVGINDGQGFLATDVGRLIRISEDTTVNWGWGVIVDVTSTTVVKVDIRRTFTITTAELKWRLGSWSTTTGYPSLGAFYEQRQFAANTSTRPQTFWATQTADLENHAPDSPNADTVVWAGVVEDDDAFDYTISADEVETIRWMSPGEDTLAMGATSGEWIPDSTGIVLTPSDVVVRRRTKHGSANIQPVRVGNVVLFAQRAKRKIREFGFAFEVDGFRAPDMTRLAQHITRGNIVEMAYQQEPDSIMWAALANGNFVSMTYRREEDVVGWARHDIGGSGSTGASSSFIITGGSLSAGANQITSITVDGTEVLGVAVDHTGDDETTAAAIVAAYNSCIKTNFVPSYDSVSKDISSEIRGNNAAAIGLGFSADGTKMYLSVSRDDTPTFFTGGIQQYTLNTAYDLSTAVYDNVFYDTDKGTSAADDGISEAPKSIVWKPDGTKWFNVDNQAGSDLDESIIEYAASTPWDISTSTLTRNLNVGGVGWDNPSCIAFNNSGTKLFLVARVAPVSFVSVFSYTLPTPYSLAGASLDGTSVQLSGIHGQDTGAIHYVAGGKRLIFGGTTNDRLYVWDMSTADSLSTLTYSGISFDYSAQEATVNGMFIQEDCSPNPAKIFLLGAVTNDAVYQYSIAPTLYLYAVSSSGSTIRFSATSSRMDTLSSLPVVAVTTAGDVTTTSSGTDISNGTSFSLVSTGIAIAESVVTIPGADGSGQVQSSEDRDEVWVTVKRTINGVPKRYIEVFERDYEEGDDAEDQYHADSIITYDGAATTSIAGLDHLEGETVKILADGYIHTDKTVSSGSITLDAAASVVQIGLPFTHTIKPLKFEGGTSMGTAVGKTKQIFGVTFVLLNSHTLGYGPDTDNIKTIDFRQADDITDTATPLFTGEQFVGFDDNWKTDPRIIVQSDDPTAFTLLALAPENDTRESRG